MKSRVRSESDGAWFATSLFLYKKRVSLESTGVLYIVMYGQTVTSFGKTVHS